MTDTLILLEEIERPKKIFPNTLQKLARHFWHSEQNKNIIKFADTLETLPNVEVVCILDEKKHPIGIIQREKIFSLLSKRFGRDLMIRDTVKDRCEQALIFSGQSNIIIIQERIREMARQNEYIVLVDSEGVFSGILSFRDLADYMVDMTNEDIALASLLQERFLSNVDKIDSLNMEIDSWWMSAKGVGGDFYFIKKITETKFFASLCDVSGKGVSAALVVSVVWGFMSGYGMQKGLKDLLSRLNELVVSSFHMEKYLTGFFILYDSLTHRLHIADMGHAHSLFLRKDKVLPLKRTRVNLPIGVEVEIEPVVYSIEVENGDILLIYSDGIPEQDNPEGEEFGEDRIIALTKKASETGENLSKILTKSIDEWKGNSPQRDDMTFIQFKFQK